jgi:hypothetical protein
MLAVSSLSLVADGGSSAMLVLHVAKKNTIPGKIETAN